MKKLIPTAKKIDAFVKALFWVIAIAGGVSVVLFGFNIILYFIDPNQATLIETTLELDYLTLHPTAEYVPSIPLTYWIVNYAFLLTGITVLCFWLQALRNVLQPMTQGLPFHETVAVNLKKLAWINIVMGVISNLLTWADSMVMLHHCHIKELFDTTKVGLISVEHHLDLNFLLLSLALFVLSYVFRYGQQLQQEVDELL